MQSDYMRAASRRKLKPFMDQRDKNAGTEYIYSIYVCDKPDSFEALEEEFKGTGIHVLHNGHAVSRLSTFIIYSVEAAALPAVVREYGPSTRVGAVVAGQTSVKAPEREAFERWLPEDVGITSVHSLHGPSVTTEGQPLVSVFFFL